MYLQKLFYIKIGLYYIAITIHRNNSKWFCYIQF